MTPIILALLFLAIVSAATVATHWRIRRRRMREEQTRERLSKLYRERRNSNLTGVTR